MRYPDFGNVSHLLAFQTIACHHLTIQWWQAIVVFMSEQKILLTTTIGSRLYGLAHENSDYDTYTVVESVPSRRKNNARQSIVGKDDAMVIDDKTFMFYAHQAIPQALEAMFSPVAEAGAFLEAYRRSFHVSLATMREKYQFHIQIEAHNGMKQRRHALRWALNFRQATNNGGRFNPVLTEAEAEWVKETANSKNFIAELRKIFPYKLDLNEKVIRDTMEAENIIG